jgi:hypothetical protein
LRQKSNFTSQINAESTVQSLASKYFAYHVGQIISKDSPCPVPTRGAYRDRHGRWSRDAMDAFGATDECARLRTAKSCGSDASTPASSLLVMIRQATVAKKPDHREEREANR